MNAEKWMELAACGHVSQTLIPMGFQPTLPELCRAESGWRVRFFYYGVNLITGVPVLEAPAYRLEFSLADGRPVSFDTLPGTGMTLDGNGSLLELGLEDAQREYLVQLDLALEQPETGAEGLYPLWLAAHPAPLSEILAQLTRTWHKSETE